MDKNLDGLKIIFLVTLLKSTCELGELLGVAIIYYIVRRDYCSYSKKTQTFSTDTLGETYQMP